jgi:hypothetical protein
MHHYWLLLIALTALLIGYPYFENSRPALPSAASPRC